MFDYSVMNEIIQINLIAIYSVLLALAARFVLRKAGSRFSYILWIVIFVSFLIPASFFTGRFSLIPKEFSTVNVAEQLAELSKMEENEDFLDAGFYANDNDVINDKLEENAKKGANDNDVITDSAANDAAFNAQQVKATWLNIIIGIWTAGFVSTFLFALWQYGKAKKMLASAEVVEKDVENKVVTMRGIPMPFLFGFWKPTIYLPDFLEKDERTYVIKHEMYHRKRKDHIVKIAAFSICILYWYNPFIWLAYHFLCVDMELSCDEAVLMEETVDTKKAYATSLLKYGARQNHFVLSSLTFGEPGMKLRIKNVLHFKKRGLVISCITILIIILLALGLLIRPESDKKVDEALQPSTIEVESQPLTMEELVRLVESGEINKFDYEKYTNGTLDDLGNSLTYLVHYELPYKEALFQFFVYYKKDTDLLTDIYLIAENNEWHSLYANGVRQTDKQQIEQFLQTRKSLSDYILTIELPDGYYLDTYDDSLGFNGGALIEPIAYEVDEHIASAPLEWIYAGYFSAVQNEQWEILSWDEDDLVPHIGIGQNHTSAEVIGMVEGTDLQAYMLKVNHDLYTAAGVYELEQSGVDISTTETTSEYWYIFFGDKENDMGYCLALTTKFFTEEEAAKIARSVKFVS